MQLPLEQWVFRAPQAVLRPNSGSIAIFAISFRGLSAFSKIPRTNRGLLGVVTFIEQENSFLKTLQLREKKSESKKHMHYSDVERPGEREKRIFTAMAAQNSI